MDPDRFADERHRVVAPTTVSVRGLVMRPFSFTIDDLALLAGASVPADRQQHITVPIIDLLSIARLRRRADLVVATDVSGRSSALPLRDVLARGTAQLIVESVPGRAADCDDWLVRLDVDGWTCEAEPLWVDELLAITFQDFVKGRSTCSFRGNMRASPSTPPIPMS